MKKTLLLAVSLVTLASSPAWADKPVTGEFAGKTKCENGMKKAGFKSPDSTNITWYTLNDISHAAQAMSWDDSSGMSFDDREKRKTQLQHVTKILRELSCDTQDNPAQNGTGIANGTQNPTTNATQNGTKANGYVQSPLPQ